MNDELFKMTQDTMRVVGTTSFKAGVESTAKNIMEIINDGKLADQPAIDTLNSVLVFCEKALNIVNDSDETVV